MQSSFVCCAVAASLSVAVLNAQEAGTEGETPLVLDAMLVSPRAPDLAPVGAGELIFGSFDTLADVPRAVTFVAAPVLEERGVDEVRELAPLAAGVSAPYRFGNLTTPHIRGDVAESYRNGQRIGANLFGVNPGFNAYDSVTLGRGPGGVVNGAGQYTGGFVSYSTRQARREATTTTLSTTLGAWAEGGSWSSARWGIDHNQPLSDSAAVRVSYEGQDDETLFHANGGRHDFEDVFLAGFWQVTERLSWEVNAQYRWEAAPQLLGVNRPTPLLVEEGLYYTGPVADGVYYAGQPWFLTPTGAVELPADATLLSAVDYSNADYWVGQSVLKYDGEGFVLVNRTLAEGVDRQRYHGFEYAEWVQGTTVDNRSELHLPLKIGGREGGVLTGLALRRELRTAYVNYFNEYFFNFDITQPGPRLLPEQFPFSYYPGRPGPEGVPFFGAAEESAETTDSTLDNAAVFAEAELPVAPDVVLALGTRWDQWWAKSSDAFPLPGATPIDDTYDTGALSWNGSLSWMPAGEQTYYVAYHRAHSIATSVTGGGILLFASEDAQGNPDGLIDPENFDNESVLWELGGRWTLSDSMTAALTFYNQTRQRMSLRSGNEDIEVRGVEFESNYSEGDWRASFNATFIEGYYRDAAPFQLGGRSIWNMFSPGVGGNGEGFKGVLDGGQVPVGDYRISGLPRWTLGAGVTYAPSSGLGAALWGEWQSRQPGNLDLEYWIPNQYSLNASLTWRGQGWELILRVLNLTGEDNWIHHGDAFMNNLIVGRELPRRAELAAKWEL